MSYRPELRTHVVTSTTLAALGLIFCAMHVRGQQAIDECEPRRFGLVSESSSGALTEDKVPDGIGAKDWSSIRAAYEAGRHAVSASRDGWQAHNPGQRWRTCFDGRGASTQPDAGGWTWGLQLERYGFPGDERDVCAPMQLSAQGQGVAYDWDATLQEWWINDGRGLEHGYTVRERPPQCEAGPLTFTLGVRGGLLPLVQADGRGVHFSNADGAEVLTYAGLVVLDADGKALPARFDLDGASLRIRIEQRDARYPLTIDPIAQQAYIKASNTNADDDFGWSVSLSGDTVVIGAYGESSNAAGVNGNEMDNSMPGSGAAYVFVRSGTTWTQQAYLKASNPDSLDYFGTAVAISGDTLVVGAFREDSNATGVNGNEADNSASSAGAAYVFVRSGTTWAQQAYLKASNAEAGDQFGRSVTVSGDTVVVGAHFEDSNATGVNGNQANNSAEHSGAAYVFVRSGTTWSQEAYIKASNTGIQDFFSWVLSVSGDTLVVAAQGEDSNATGVNGNQFNNLASFSGAAYVFVRSGTTWSQEAYLKA